MSILILIQFASCLFMTGLIWLVQLVHYPSFAFVADEKFVEFSLFHQKMISCIVLPVMVVEFTTAIYLAYAYFGVDKWYLLNFSLLALIWGSTFFLSVPLHEKLSAGTDPELIRKLVVTNWPRTILWSARSLAWILFVLKIKDFARI